MSALGLAVVAALFDGASRVARREWPVPVADRALIAACIVSSWTVMLALGQELRAQWTSRASQMVQRRVAWVGFVIAGGVLGACAGEGGMLRRLAPSWIYVAVGLVGGGVLGRLVWRAWGTATKRWPRGAARAAALLAFGILAIDRVVLVRRYGWLHAALLIAGGLLLVVATATARRRIDRAGLLVAAAATIALLPLVSARPVVRALLVEHSRLVGRLMPLLPDPSTASTVASSSPRRDPATRLRSSAERLDESRGIVLLVSVDAWRREAFSSRLTPQLWALAQHGTCWAHAYTPTPHTSLALASLHTGRDVGPRTERAPLGADTPLLAEHFRQAGWKSAAFYPPAVFTIEPERIKTLAERHFGFEYVKQQFSSATARTQEILAYLDEVRPSRAFVWVHYFEPHEPYEAHGDASATTAEARYEREVATVDRAVSELLAKLAARGEPVRVVLTADHGEEFGEHGGRYHGTTLYEEQVAVPLCIFQVGSSEPARVWQHPVSLVDVMPTLLAWLGVGNPLDGDGLVLDRAIDRDVGPAFATLGAEAAVIEARWKLIVSKQGGGQQLFDLVGDPGERSNRAAADAAVVSRLRAAALGYADRGGAGDAVSARIEQRIQRAALGDEAAATELLRDLPTLDASSAARVAAFLASQRERTDVRPLDVAAVAAVRAKMPEGTAARWLDVLVWRGPPAMPWLSAACRGAAVDLPLCAEAALAARDVSTMSAIVLERTLQESVRLRLIAALGESGGDDPRAGDALAIAMAEVRLRSAAVRALDRLGGYQSIGWIARWAPHEPYVDARLAMVQFLQRATRRDPSGTARAALATIQARETEATIRAQLARGAPTDEPTHAK